MSWLPGGDIERVFVFKGVLIYRGEPNPREWARNYLDRSIYKEIGNLMPELPNQATENSGYRHVVGRKLAVWEIGIGGA
jgi:hypothetical protein